MKLLTVSVWFYRSCLQAVQLLNREIPVLIEKVGLSIPDAIRMVTKYHQELFTSIRDWKHKIRPFCGFGIFNDDFTPVRVFQKGITVYSVN